MHPNPFTCLCGAAARHLLIAFIASMLFFTGTAQPKGKNKIMEQHNQAVAQLPPPALVVRPSNKVLEEFRKLVRAYISSNGENEIIFGVDPILNRSGKEKEVQPDLSWWVRQVIAAINGPFRTVQAVSAREQVRPQFPGLSSGGQEPESKPPAITYRITGALQAVVEESVLSNQTELSLRAGGGNGAVDGSHKRNRRITITTYTILLILERPNGEDIPGATAAYTVKQIKDEFDRSLGIYVSGSGLSHGTTLTLTDDLSGGLFDAMALAATHVIGAALSVPFYRCSPLFPVDDQLDDSKRQALNRMTRSELEDEIKRFLYLSGIDMDMTVRGPSAQDRVRMTQAMRNAQLDSAQERDLVAFALSEWKGLDYNKASEVVDRRIDDVIRRQREQIESEKQRASAQAREVARWNIGPEKFGWPASTRILLLDLTRITDAQMRERIVAAVRQCKQCGPINADATNTVAGIRLTSDASQVQQALRHTGLNVDYAWAGDKQPRLCVLPK